MLLLMSTKAKIFSHILWVNNAIHKAIRFNVKKEPIQNYNEEKNIVVSMVDVKALVFKVSNWRGCDS